MDDEYDLQDLKHPEWAKKIKEIEHNLLLGVISCLACGVDAIMDVDQLLDEVLRRTKVTRHFRKEGK